MIEREIRRKFRTHKLVGMTLTSMLLLTFVGFSVLLGVSSGDPLIANFYSCDRLGNPQYSFPRKSKAYFNVCITNPAPDPKNISIRLTVQDELDVPVGTSRLDTTIPKSAAAYYVISVFLAEYAYVGIATGYASLLVEGTPVNGKTTQLYIGPQDLTPPTVVLLSPGDGTVVTRPVPLVFKVNEGTDWIGYRLDGLANVTIDGNSTLTNLPIGSHKVMVYANDTSGNQGFSQENQFTAVNRPPEASFTESATTVPTGTTITFNASSSYDLDGYVVEYAWDLGDGTSGTNIITGHAYTENGTYTVTLTVTDNDGATAIAATNITVLNRNPVASFTESGETVPTGTVISFNASASFDPDGSIVAYTWDFGDSNAGSGILVDHSYPDNGVYNVTLTVTDNDEASSVAWALKTVLNRPPVANFSETAETIYVGEYISFNASPSYDPDGTIAVYYWDFGDGTNGTGILIDHGYGHSGTYTVALTVTDDDGASTSTSTIKNVLNRPDIEVSNVTTSKTILGQGYSLSIRANATNRSDHAEVFNVTICANTTVVATQTISLAAGGSVIVTFVWDSAGFAMGNYIVSAYAWPLPGETETANNNCTCAIPVHVGVPGDVSSITSGVYDGVVNVRDITYLTQLFYTKPGNPNWNPNADVDGNGVIDVRDITIAIINFMRHE